MVARMMSRPVKHRIIATVGAVALAGFLGMGLLFAREEAPPAKVEAQHVLTVPVAGDPGKEVDIQIYTFPPGSSVPWHIHPGAQEFEYELEGTLMLEEKGKPPRALKTGETFHLAPDVVHRGWNPSKTEPAKIYVVRIKPVGAPLATVVKPPKEEGSSDAPATDAYPGLRP